MYSCSFGCTEDWKAEKNTISLFQPGINVSLCLFIARLVHISHLPCLQEFYTCQLFVLVSAVQFIITKNVFGCIHLLMKPVCLLKVCDRGVWGSGHTAERPEDPRDVPERHEEVQSGFTQGQNKTLCWTFAQKKLLMFISIQQIWRHQICCHSLCTPAHLQISKWCSIKIKTL